MSDRLTPIWTDTTAEVFGAAGVKGREGEVLVQNILIENTIPARDFEQEKRRQVSGVDIETTYHSIDVKANLQDGVFFVEVNAAGWLFNPQKISDIILHIDTATKQCVWYLRDAAKQKFRVDNRLIMITPANFRPDFMSTSWDDLFSLLRVDKGDCTP